MDAQARAGRAQSYAEKTVRFLLDHGADPSIMDRWGIFSALSLAEYHKLDQLVGLDY